MIFRRILSLLKTLKFFKKTYSLVYTDEICSTNDIYESRHWGVRLSKEARVKRIVRGMFDKNKPPRIEEFGLVVFYNNLMDVDNLTFMSKVFVDALRKEMKVTIHKDPLTKKPLKGLDGKQVRTEKLVYEGFVENDNQKHYQFLHLCPDKSLPKHSIEFVICIIK